MERHTVKRTVRYGAIGLFICIILGYGLLQAKNLLEGPVIAIISPANGSSFNHSLIEITGQTKNIVTISVNDRPIFIDDKGFFKEEYLLSPGYTIVTVKAKDRFGRTAQKTLELDYISP